MIIQEQKWSDHTRIVFVEEHSSVMLELFDEPQFGTLRMTAFVFNLWTSPEYRRHGQAARMLSAAERTALQRGHSSVFLDWELKESPLEILDWYMRNGYERVGFNSKGDYFRLKKNSKKPQLTNNEKENLHHTFKGVSEDAPQSRRADRIQ